MTAIVERRGIGGGERASRRSGALAWIATHIVLPVLVLGGFSVAVLYVRLLNGPISLAPLAAPIARSLSSEFPGFTVSVEDAIVRLTGSGAFEFRLRNVHINDSEGQRVAVAPLAAMSLSERALWSGRLTPEQVVLIEPRLLLQAPGGGAEPVSTRRAGATPARPVAGSSAGSLAGDDLSTTPLRRIDVTRALRDAAARARVRPDAVTFLRRIGMRQASLIVDQGTHQSVLRVLDAWFDLEHRESRSALSGWAQIASSREPVQMEFRAEEAEASDDLSITGVVSDAVPAALGDVLSTLLPGKPALSSALAALDAPVGAHISAVLGADGGVKSVTAAIDVGAGNIRFGAASSAETSSRRGIEAATIALQYQASSRRIEIAPSTVRSGGSHVVLVGAIEQRTERGPWTVHLEGKSGALSPSEPGAEMLPLERLSLDCTLDPATGGLMLTRGIIGAGGGEITAEANLPGAAGASPRLDVRLSTMSHKVAKALWPAFIAPGARDWVAAHLLRGRIVSGAIRLETVATSEPAAAAGSPSRQKLSLTVESADVELAPLAGFATIEAPRMLVRLDGETLDLTMPDAALVAGPQRRLGIKAGRFYIADVAGDQPLGEITFRPQGSLAALVAVLDREPIALSQKAGSSLDGIDGKVDGTMKIVVPLEQDVLLRDVTFDGKIVVSEGRAKALLGGYDVQGASLTIDVARDGIEARGDLLVQGVAARLSMQHLLNTASDKPQPPLRLTATLDANDRLLLGLDVNHIVAGDIAAEVLVPRGRAGEAPRARLDLTGAELSIAPISWTKPAGRAAVLTFDIAKGSKFKTELQNVKIIGDDIAADGWMGLDANSRLREMYFPEIALNVISRFELQGSLRPDNVWDVRIKGPIFDGKDVFRSLFSIGASGPGAPAAARGQRESAGVDLKAEIDTLLGFADISLRGVRLQAARRGDRLSALTIRGTVDGGKPLDVVMQPGTQPRTVLVTTDDAGQAFRMIGFYPNMRSGRLRLTVNLDGRGPAEKTGRMEIADFALLGDTVVDEVLSGNEEGFGRSVPAGATRTKPRLTRQVVSFDSLAAPFAVGNGQFVLEDATLAGPILNANIRGKADFRSRRLNLAGTSAPGGLNSAVGAVPLLGQILTGQRGEGLFGITFAIQGTMEQPQVLFNPLSLLTPGFLREITQISNPSTQVTAPPERTPPRRDGQSTRASSSSAVTAPAGGSTQPAADVGGAWTSNVEPRRGGAAQPEPKR